MDDVIAVTRGFASLTFPRSGSPRHATRPGNLMVSDGVARVKAFDALTDRELHPRYSLQDVSGGMPCIINVRARHLVSDK